MTTTLPPPGEQRPRWALGFFCAGLIVAGVVLLFVPDWRWAGGLILLGFWVPICWRLQRGYSLWMLFRRDSWRR